MFRCNLTATGWKLLTPSIRSCASFLLLMGVLLKAGDALGPPPGAAGTLDWRYPDPVIGVPMPCTSEGFFRHSLFCNWYYRCYETAYFPGYFRRAIFMCPSGTEFSEGAEQCVWMGSSDTDNNGFPCSFLDDSWPQGVAISTGAQPVPTDGGSNVDTGLAGGASNVDTEDCKISVSSCREDFLCLPEFMPRVAYAVPTQVCEIANRDCPSSVGAVCPDGDIWDAINEICLPMNYLCRQAPEPAEATYDSSAVKCNFEIGSEVFDVVACWANDPSRPVPFRGCYEPTRSCMLQSDISSSQTLNEADICPASHLYNLFKEECEPTDSASEAHLTNQCDHVAPDNDGALIHCTVMKTACDEYVSCETEETFIGCTNYYHCDSQIFSAESLCPLGQVSLMSAPGQTNCMPIATIATPRLQGNTTCVSTGDQPLLAASEPVPRQTGLDSFNYPHFTGKYFSRKERSASDPFSGKPLERSAIEVTESKLGDSLLPSYHLDTLKPTNSRARKLASPSVPESLMTLANSLQSYKENLKSVDVLPVLAVDSKHTLTQLSYFDSPSQSDTTAGTTPSADGLNNETNDLNATIESNSTVQMNDQLCQFGGERPLPQNFQEVLECSEKEVCDSSGRLLVTVMGCSTLVQCMTGPRGKLEPEYLSCSPHHFFVPTELRCRDYTYYGGVPCPKEHSSTPTLTCTAEYEVLELSSQESKQHCSSYAGCSDASAVDQVGVTLCSAFYQCLLEPASSTIQPVLMACEQSMLFSYQHIQCLPPTSPLLCQ